MRSSKPFVLVALLLSATCIATAWAASPAPPAFVTANFYNAPIANKTLHNDRDNLIVAVHGWTASPAAWWLTGTDAWNNPGLKDTLTTALGASDNNYDLWGLDWSQGAAGSGVYPSTANEINAQLQGQYLARTIASGNYKNVQLLGHSLGGRVIETATTILKQVLPNLNVQETFLDAYTPYNWPLVYGSNATYADSYYTNLDTISGTLTASQFPSALNVNMNAFVTPRPAAYTPFGPDNNQLISSLNDESWRHNAPHRFYKATVADPNNAIYAGYGFANSHAGGAATPPAGASKAPGQNVILAANGTTTSTPVPQTAITNAITRPAASSAITGSANALVDEPSDAVTLSAFSAAGNQLGYVDFKFQTTSPLNFFEFNYNWPTLASGAGRLTFYLFQSSLLGGSNSLLWASDSVNAFENTTLSTGKIIWTGTDLTNNPTTDPLAAGDYELRFRLDYLSGENTSVTISNIHAGLLTQVPEPASLALLAGCVIPLLLGRHRSRLVRR